MVNNGDLSCLFFSTTTSFDLFLSKYQLSSIILSLLIYFQYILFILYIYFFPPSYLFKETILLNTLFFHRN